MIAKKIIAMTLLVGAIAPMYSNVAAATNNAEAATIVINNADVATASSYKKTSIHLNDYSGKNYTEKLKALVADVTSNYKNDVMEITLPSGIIEITEDIIIDGWTNKTINATGALYFKNCNAIEFKNLQHCDINIHRVSSEIPSGRFNPQGFISIESVNNLTKEGLKFTDCSYNRISINQVLGFKTGIILYSEYGSKGTFYNDFHVGTIWRCQVGYSLLSGKAADDTSSISGWVNDNRFYNTMIDCNKGIIIGQSLNKRPKGEPTDSYHNNKFYNIGFEQIRDKKDAVAIDMIQGVSNSFVNPRFEGGMADKGYIFIREGKDAALNVYETSNYMLNINRIQLNTSGVKENGANQGKQMSMVHASLIKEGTGVLANKMTAIKDKLIYEAYGVSNYYLTNYCPNNLINYTFSDTEFAKYKDSKGNIRVIKFDQ